MSQSAPQVRCSLSYASQDQEAARRIFDALRAAGIEVWFDQSELRGGEVWDQKMRREIRDCALFIPVISANSDARHEGYFRCEWRLAVERAGDMSERVAFLFPVVIDDTSESRADVPSRFREVQWTRLPGGETLPALLSECGACCRRRHRPRFGRVCRQERGPRHHHGRGAYYP